MPFLDKQPVGNGFLALWRREESTMQLLDQLVLSPAEQSYYEQIAQQPKRRKEWLIWHILVRECLGNDVFTDYDAQGCPMLMNHPGYISVSHSNDIVALYWQPERCGVDIEDCGRNFARVAKRYISPEEWQLPGASDSNRFQALAWCAKETAYKYAGVAGLDFLRDIRITSIDTEKSELVIELSDGQVIPMKYGFPQGHCIAYTLL